MVFKVTLVTNILLQVFAGGLTIIWLFTKFGVNTLHDGHGDFDILLKVDGDDYDLLGLLDNVANTLLEISGWWSWL